MAAIKFLDLRAQYLGIKPQIDAAIETVLTDCAFVGGPHVARFEANFAKFQQAAYCVAVGNGTDSLEIALEALKLPAGGEVIVPANSFIASSEAVTRAGLRNGTRPEELGKPTLMPLRLTETPADLVARDFGAAFAAALEKVPVGEWAGPIDSSFGAHYVRVSERTPAVVPQLAAVRDHVVREWENERRQRARNDAYVRMRDGYEVSIEATAPTEQP